MVIIGGEPKLRIHVRRLRQRSPSCHPFGDFHATAGADMAAIDLIGEGWHQKHYIRDWLRGANDEGQEVLAGIIADMGGIETARPVRRHRQRETLGPAQWPLVVIVEMDGAVLLWGRFPVMHLAGPVRTGHGAGGQVDQGGMGRMRSGVGRDLRLDTGGKIPGGNESPTAGDRGALDLTVEMRTRRARPLARQRGDQHIRRPRWRRCALHARCASIPQLRVRGLRNTERAVSSKLSDHIGPTPFQQLLRNFRNDHAAVHPGCHRHGAATWTNAERHLPGANLHRKHALQSLRRRGWPDRGGQPHSLAKIERHRGMGKTAEMRVLFNATERPVQNSRHDDRFIAWSCWIGIRTEVANKPNRVIAPASA